MKAVDEQIAAINEEIKRTHQRFDEEPKMLQHSQHASASAAGHPPPVCPAARRCAAAQPQTGRGWRDLLGGAVPVIGGNLCGGEVAVLELLHDMAQLVEVDAVDIGHGGPPGLIVFKWSYGVANIAGVNQR
ncbi:hypothetical protein FQA39_LY19169 [Lamprigera yunnana]|nr:hypothetical protein FQA39_LY19169 [Lamprigera yunnana]